MLKIIRAIILFVTVSIVVQHVAGQSTATPASPDKMLWWKDAKFGMFIHWGLYAVPAGTYQGKPVGGIGEWIMNTAKIPTAEYKLYAKEFNPVKYDPQAWVRMAKAAGMKYIIITSKHHDGFALFNSKVTDWDVVDATPYGKDLLTPLVEACHKEGIRIGFYYSQAQDWNHPGGVASGGHWDKAQDGDMDVYLDKIAVPQVKEILSNYGNIDILWWDTPQDMTQARAEKFLPVLNLYPNLIMNNRLGGGLKGDTETPEQFIPPTGFPNRNWEACMTMNDTWGYKSYDQNWKSTKTLIRNLEDIVSKGGNFLLNVGPTPLGEIPQPSQDRLAEVGKWIDLNKESIYGTTASPFAYLSWGRCTRKDQKLYLHVFDYPADGKLWIPMTNKITSAYLLSAPTKKLITKTDHSHSLVELPKQQTDSVSTIVVVEFAKAIEVSPAPTAGKSIKVSSQKSESTGSANLIDGDRLTRWEAAAGERKAELEINLKKPMLISTMIVDEPWHPWENKQQQITLQYKLGNYWVTISNVQTGGVGNIQKFKPVTAQYFKVLIENHSSEPVLLEWQLYGPE